MLNPAPLSLNAAQRWGVVVGDRNVPSDTTLEHAARITLPPQLALGRIAKQPRTYDLWFQRQRGIVGLTPSAIQRPKIDCWVMQQDLAVVWLAFLYSKDGPLQLPPSKKDDVMIDAATHAVLDLASTVPAKWSWRMLSGYWRGVVYDSWGRSRQSAFALKERFLDASRQWGTAGDAVGPYAFGRAIRLALSSGHYDSLLWLDGIDLPAFMRRDADLKELVDTLADDPAGPSSGLHLIALLAHMRWRNYDLAKQSFSMLERSIPPSACAGMLADRRCLLQAVNVHLHLQMDNSDPSLVERIRDAKREVIINGHPSLRSTTIQLVLDESLAMSLRCKHGPIGDFSAITLWQQANEYSQATIEWLDTQEHVPPRLVADAWSKRGIVLSHGYQLANDRESKVRYASEAFAASRRAEQLLAGTSADQFDLIEAKFHVARNAAHLFALDRALSPKGGDHSVESSVLVYASDLVEQCRLHYKFTPIAPDHLFKLSLGAANIIEAISKHSRSDSDAFEAAIALATDIGAKCTDALICELNVIHTRAQFERARDNQDGLRALLGSAEHIIEVKGLQPDHQLVQRFARLRQHLGR